jgi:diguanylate cyclase (GGDEF)-like protein/PAS domain S-box-containing protein
MAKLTGQNTNGSLDIADRRPTGTDSVPGLSGDTYRNFIENLPVMFYAVAPDPPHTPMYISPTFELFGYPLENWMTDTEIWDRVIHPDDRDAILAKTREAMRLGDSIDFEYRVVCKNGENVWVHDRSCFIKDENGKKICWQGVILNVTPRVMAQHELARRERLYHTLAAHLKRSAVLLFDQDLRFTLAEGERLASGRYKKEDFENKNLEEAFPPHIVEYWRPFYERALAGEDISFEHKSEEGYFQVDLQPVYDENGEIFAGMVMWEDISERKKAEEALRESESRYRELFEDANDIIYVHDLSGNFISTNKAAESIFGYTKAEALSLNIGQIAVPEHVERVRNQLARKVAGDTAQTVYEVDCIRKDGERVTLEVNSSIVLKDGKPLAVQGIARDITERKQSEETIRKSEERYRDLFENANDLIYTHDLQGNFTSLNRSGEKITGYSRAETLKMHISEVVAPEFLESAKTMTSKKLKDDRPTTYELEIIRKDGRRVPLELSTRLIVNNGLPVGVQGVGRDITERRQAEASLHNTLSLFTSTFESTADGIVVMSLDRQIITANRKFIQMWNVDKATMASKDGLLLIDLIAEQVKNTDDFRRQLRETYADPRATFTELLELKDGRIFERYSQPQYLEGKPVGRVACFRDITERTQAEERLRHYALHDTLTDLPNRVSFMNHLRYAVERAGDNEHARFAVLFLDLDRFKVINDSLGHAVGDKLLIAIAERLTACVRPGDIVARLGGDEFTILLNRSGQTSEVAGVAERLQARISEPFKIDNYEVFTTASIGIVVSSNVTRNAEDFLRDADAAMYRAKESGKARYEIFDREMHVRNMNLLQVETDLRHAVERNEFEVLYQPIVDITTGRAEEFEALIRWRHPVHGLVNPNEFITVAEETGLIIPIGRWILAESCRQIAEWQRRFKRPFSISVNLSAKQLMHPNLTSQVKDILIDAGIGSSQLKLEVTESTVMEHSEKSLKVLSDLDKLGVALSTDDFGTGYSSLSYLQKFPFERLKIDRSFINRMDQDEKSGAIVKTILMLGENLGLEVVAEGIETAAQLDKLRSLGCTKAQGYLFSRPIDREAAEQFLESGANVFSDKPSLEFHNPAPMIEVADLQ